MLCMPGAACRRRKKGDGQSALDWCWLYGYGQRKGKGAALALDTLDPYLPAVSLNQASGNGQAQSTAPHVAAAGVVI